MQMHTHTHVHLFLDMYMFEKFANIFPFSRILMRQLICSTLGAQNSRQEEVRNANASCLAAAFGVKTEVVWRS